MTNLEELLKYLKRQGALYLGTRPIRRIGGLLKPYGFKPERTRRLIRKAEREAGLHETWCHGCSRRTYYALRAAGIHRWRTLLRRSEVELLESGYIGPRVLAEIKEYLKDYERSLAPNRKHHPRPVVKDLDCAKRIPVDIGVCMHWTYSILLAQGLRTLGDVAQHCPKVLKERLGYTAFQDIGKALVEFGIKLPRLERVAFVPENIDRKRVLSLTVYQMEFSQKAYKAVVRDMRLGTVADLEYQPWTFWMGCLGDSWRKVWREILGVVRRYNLVFPPTPPDRLSLEIKNLKLDPLACALLERHDVRTLGDLAKLSPENFLKWRGRRSAIQGIEDMRELFGLAGQAGECR